MITWYENKDLKILTDIAPKTTVRKPLPTDTKAVKKDKKAKPFLNKKRVIFTIYYKDEQYCILIEKGYVWNGSNIPRGLWALIGSMENTQYLNASMIHDYILERKALIKYNRELSSDIFYGMLIGSGVGKTKAKIMRNAVDIFQKLFCDWRVK